MQFDDFISPIAFRYPEKIDSSGWIEHIPFAFWLTERARPRQLVELGVHHGVSYLAFCQSVQQSGLTTKCFGVDTWKGDDHAGFYGDDVYDALAAYHDVRYSNFSRLVRSTFAEAVDHFEDGTIDLLHIDGRHGYEDVKSDFESWLPKLSAQAVVLFHDTNVRENNFGVFRFWKELVERHSESFEFHHGNGLGVLGFGNDLPVAVRAFFAAGREEDTATCIRAAYYRLGRSLSDALIAHQRAQELSVAQVDFRRILSELRRAETEFNTERNSAQGSLDRLEAERDAERQLVGEQIRRLETERDAERQRVGEEIRRLETERDAERQRVGERFLRLETERDAQRQRVDDLLRLGVERDADRQRIGAQLRRLEGERDAERQRTGEELRRQKAERDADRECFGEQLRRLEADRQRLEAERQQLEAEHEARLEAIYRSTSWQITRPIRATSRAVRKTLRGRED